MLLLTIGTGAWLARQLHTATSGPDQVEQDDLPTCSSILNEHEHTVQALREGTYPFWTSQKKGEGTSHHGCQQLAREGIKITPERLDGFPPR